MMPVLDLLPVLQVSPTLSPTHVLARKFRDPAVSCIAASASSVRLGLYSFSMRQYLELGGQGVAEGGDTRHWGVSVVLHWLHCRQSPRQQRERERERSPQVITPPTYPGKHSGWQSAPR